MNEERLDMREVLINPAWALKITPIVARRKQVLPFTVIKDKLLVATPNPNNLSGLRSVEKTTGMSVQLELADEESFQEALQNIFGKGLQNPSLIRSESYGGLEESIELGNRILDSAILRRASDVHIDPDENSFLVRFRVAGIMEIFEELPNESFVSLINRFKVQGNMDISERRSPQDGHIRHTFKSNGLSVDIRTATIPTKHGEKMTLRFLGAKISNLSLESLGMIPSHLEIAKQNFNQPHGMILITGPTGSGKSTTLYAALKGLSDKEDSSIITIEDPVELDLPRVNQVQIDSEKITFPQALRSSLRHDPDVIMIGEIRDKETAEIAVTASMTGHLVLSTLHTNSAPSSIIRLINMGLEPYLISSVLRLAVAQRLVRKLCSKCHKPKALSKKEAVLLGDAKLEGSTAYHAKGCKYCDSRGFKGRIGLFEVLPLTNDILQILHPAITEVDLLNVMKKKSIPTLMDDGIKKIKAGLVSVEEVLRVANVR